MKSKARTAVKKFSAMASAAPRTAREKRIAKSAAVAAAVVTQVSRGEKPNVSEALKIAGVGDNTAATGREMTSSENVSIIAALDRAGITDSRLISKAEELLEAQHTKFFAHKGEVIDERDVADNKIRHAVWRDLMMVKGHLRNDEGQAVGGLMIINAVQAVTPGHDINCNCPTCLSTWEAAAEQNISEQERRERSKIIDAAPELAVPRELNA